ncbi:MAG: aspartate carbamoyltransferase catalytic subunit [Pseudomonadota bacterium]
MISVDDLSLTDITYLLNLADYYADYLRMGARPAQRLAGKTQINLFFENSTRTNLSFELAGAKLGADVINVPVAASSVNKDESLLDTAQTLAAMAAHVVILRHAQPGVQSELQETLPCPIINAGDGSREHPTQALLDAATIRSAFGRTEGLTVAICGDVRHSRVAASDAKLFQRLGMHVRFVAPRALLPNENDMPGIPRYDSLKDGLAGADIAMGLRMQFERMDQSEAAAMEPNQYYSEFGLTHETLGYANDGALVMHPGPMNRGVEIDGALADDQSKSLILNQVFFGVATRMACLDAILCRTND